jgi:hypothetical protein
VRGWASERVGWRDPQIPSLLAIQQRINDMYVTSIINREGFHHMTVTTENTTQVTLDTEDGTIIRLIDGSQTHADEGALGVVDRTLGTDQTCYLPVTWLKGHEKDGMSQMNGGYSPETFEVCEFQVGDRVRVINSQFEFGHEGVIASIPATNGDDCIVAVDFPCTMSLSYLFDRLEKVTIVDPLKALRDGLMRAFGQPVPDEPEDDCCASYYEDDEEPLAEWEKELLYGDVVEPVSTDLQPGDIAVIDLPADRLLGDEMDMSEWEGLRFVVGTGSNGWDYELVDGVIDSRPDKYDGDFYWPKGQVRRFEAYDYCEGDLVESYRFGKNGQPAKAVVTRLEGEFGGDIEVNWTEGLDTLVAYGPIGARREHLTLVGVQEETGFEFEAGQEVSPEALADLPHETVLTVENGVALIAYLPTV